MLHLCQIDDEACCGNLKLHRCGNLRLHRCGNIFRNPTFVLYSRVGNDFAAAVQVTLRRAIRACTPRGDLFEHILRFADMLETDVRVCVFFFFKTPSSGLTV